MEDEEEEGEEKQTRSKTENRLCESSTARDAAELHDIIKPRYTEHVLKNIDLATRLEKEVCTRIIRHSTHRSSASICTVTNWRR